MTEKTYVVAVAVAGLCFLGVLVIATVALFLGRGVRAEGRAKLGKEHGVTVSVDVPGTPEKTAGAEVR